jgi:hypothetical protein
MVLLGDTGTAERFAPLGLVGQYWIKLYLTAIGAGQVLFQERTEPRLTRRGLRRRAFK